MIRTLPIMILALTPLAHAWQNHAIPATIAVSQMPELTGAAKIPAESLDNFLKTEQQGLVKVLADEEAWARAHVAKYPRRPASLAFQGGYKDAADLRAHFLHEIRVNPNAKFTLYLQQMPGSPGVGKSYLPLGDVTLLPNSMAPTELYFTKLEPGKLVDPAQVFATASDEPDYGLDIGLWDDSHTDFGRLYHFGPQPFGNPKLEFSSQAPFHMGYYHESGIIFMAAEYLTHTYPGYRIHMMYSLSRFAFKTGHPYWGWRFAGIGSHYIQDLTQPFHTTVMPGENTAKTLWVGFLDMLGIHGPKERVIEEVSDQHLALENQVYCELANALVRHDLGSPMVKALESEKDDRAPKYSNAYVRNVLTAESNSFASQTALAMKQILPQSHAVKNSVCEMSKVSVGTERLLGRLMKNFGIRTREYVRAIRS